MKRMRSLAISILVFSLLLVAVGSYLSFHSDLLPSHSAVSMFSQFDIAGIEMDSAHQDFDPCEEGYCHLGHCAKLVFAFADIPTIQIPKQMNYAFKASAIPDLFLDPPYQPPKRV